jgi:hypothetical protein
LIGVRTGGSSSSEESEEEDDFDGGTWIGGEELEVDGGDDKGMEAVRKYQMELRTGGGVDGAGVLGMLSGEEGEGSGGAERGKKEGETKEERRSRRAAKKARKEARLHPKP